VAKIGANAFMDCEGPLHCEAPSKPAGWASTWVLDYSGQVLWDSSDPTP
jgi:hypothetical protein